MSELLKTSQFATTPTQRTATPLVGASAELRVDAPHQFGAQAAVPNAEPSPAAMIEAESPPEQAAGSEESLLLQASQIAEHFSRKYAELNRREQRLNSQLIQLDQERRNVRLWVAQIDEQVHERDLAVREREARCATRETACIAVEQDVQTQRLSLLQRKAELDAERQAFHDELEAGRNELAAERDIQLDELASERAACQLELTAARDALTAELDLVRIQIDEERHAHRQQVVDELLLHHQELKQQREQLEAERRVQLLELQRLTADAETLRSNGQAELEQERTLLHNRVRFQLDHLQNARAEFEALQAEFLGERQAERTLQAEIQMQFKLRWQQFARFRHLLEEREQGLEREHEALAKARKALQESLGLDKLRSEQQIQAWEREQQIVKAEIRRQQDLLTRHAENLEARRERLDRLRAELDQTHAHTLEMRVAVEEACAQLQQAAGGAAATARLDDARQALSRHFSQAREVLVRQREELDDARRLFQQQCDEFRAERQTLADWMARRDEELRLRESEFRQERAVFDARESAWRAKREGWQREKLEAERIIRDLLRQLTNETIAR